MPMYLGKDETCKAIITATPWDRTYKEQKGAGTCTIYTAPTVLARPNRNRKPIIVERQEWHFE